MTTNENGPQVLEAPRGREDQAAGGSRSAVSMPQPSDIAQQGALFPGSDEPPIVRPIALATRGRVEFTGKCPCGSWHRHVHLGLVTGPCGTEYQLITRAMQGAA